MTKISVLGIDLAKDVFQLHGLDAQQNAVLRKKVGRETFKKTMVNLPPCLIGMEACSGSNYWGREFTKLGHTVRLIAPQFVRPYVKTNKNDATDAEAIAEAVTRPNMRFVPIKERWQQDVQVLHRMRSRLVKNRTAIGNTIRGFLREYGVILPLGIQHIHKRLSTIVETHEEITDLIRGNFLELLEELGEIERRIEKSELQIKQVFKENEKCRRIAEIEGIGPMTATAIVAAIGDPRQFKNGRQMSAWLGLVPRQHSSGGKNKLLGISKRGDVYLRTLLIHGARAALCAAKLKGKSDPRSQWAIKLLEKKGANLASTALANKNARIIWAMLASGNPYRKAA